MDGRNGNGIDGDILARAYPEVSLGHGLQFLGLSHIAIGAGSCIGDGTWLNVCDRSGGVRLSLGRNVLVGRHSMLSTGGRLEIGDFNLFAPRVYVSDADHVFEDIGVPYIEQGATLGRSVVVEENCWLGINVVVSGNLVVGRGSVVAANSVVVDTVPPFAVMAGVPARIVKLFNPRSRKWESAGNVPEQIRILEDRLSVPLPGREEYREMLWKRSKLDRIDPVLAGAGRHLD